MRNNGIFTLGQKRKIINELTKVYGLRCWYCGVRFEEENLSICIDHIIPISKGGSNDISNLALSCKFCNSHKFYHPLEDFLNYLAYIRTGKFSCPILEQFSNKLDPVTVDILSKGFREGDYENGDKEETIEIPLEIRKKLIKLQKEGYSLNWLINCAFQELFKKLENKKKKQKERKKLKRRR